MPKLYAGLDVSQDKTSICVVDEAATRIYETEVATAPSAIATALRPYKRSLAIGRT